MGKRRIRTQSYSNEHFFSRFTPKMGAKMDEKMDDKKTGASSKLIISMFILGFVIGLAITYFVWVGIMWLVATAFGLTFNIWLAGFVGIIAQYFIASLIKTVKG